MGPQQVGCRTAGHGPPLHALFLHVATSYLVALTASMSVPNAVKCHLRSAYGKNGQLERALEIWRDMAARGCERNVITYSSLISACEKSGRWQLALDLFAEMHREGCKPNVVCSPALSRRVVWI